MFLEPSRSFFHIDTMEGWLLAVAASIVGLLVGMLVARWVNHLCEEPARKGEVGLTALLTASIFGLATIAIIFVESQRVDEVIPEVSWRYGRWIAHLSLLALLIAATATDLREYIIPDQITYSGVLFGLSVATVSGDAQLIHFWVDWNHPLVGLQGPAIPQWIQQHPHWHGLVWSLTGAVLGGGVTWLARGISSRILGQEAMGLGDVTLMAMIGSFLGWQPTVFVFAFAPFCGLIVGLLARSIFNRSYVPYGPYLSAAAFIVMLSWKWIWTWQPTTGLTIRELFSHVKYLAILASFSVVLLLALLGILRWWRGSPREPQPF